MKLLPKVLPVDDNPVDVRIAQETLAGGRRGYGGHTPDVDEGRVFERLTGPYTGGLRQAAKLLDFNLPREEE